MATARILKLFMNGEAKVSLINFQDVQHLPIKLSLITKIKLLVIYLQMHVYSNHDLFFFYPCKLIFNNFASKFVGLYFF